MTNIYYLLAPGPEVQRGRAGTSGKDATKVHLEPPQSSRGSSGGDGEDSLPSSVNLAVGLGRSSFRLTRVAAGRPQVLVGCRAEYPFSGAAVTSYHKLDSFRRTGIYSFTVLRTIKSRVRMSAGPCPFHGCWGDPSLPFSRLPAVAALLGVLGS